VPATLIENIFGGVTQSQVLAAVPRRSVILVRTRMVFNLVELVEHMMCEVHPHDVCVHLEPAGFVFSLLATFITPAYFKCCVIVVPSDALVRAEILKTPAPTPMQVRCLACGYESNTYEPLMDLSLEVHKIQSVRWQRRTPRTPPASRRPTRDDVSHPPGRIGIPQVKDALRKMTHIETLSGANAYKCDKCVRTPCSRVAPSSFLRSPLHSRLSHTSLVPVHLPPPLSLAPASESV